MKWTLILSLWAFSAMAVTPVVFMRETEQGKQIILRENSIETALTSGETWHLYPDISSDGRWIVWVEGPNDKNLSVVLYNTATRARERWETNFQGMALHPRFTKNAQMVFFSMPTATGNKIATFSPATSRGQLITTEQDGTRVYKVSPELIPHEGMGYFPRPSADGAYLLFQRNFDGKKEIVEYNRLTKTTRVLAEGMAPALSADEAWILYTSKVQGSWDVWIYNRSNGDTTPLTDDEKDEMAPTFTADNRVAFSSNRSGHFQIYQVTKGEWKQLVTSDADDYAPMFAGETSWRQSMNAPFLAPQRSSFGSIEHEGKIYLCGGHAGAEHTYPPESFTDNLQVYDPATGSWRELAPRPHKAHGFQMAAYGRYLFAFGGFAYNATTKPRWKSIDVIDRYDILTNTWETIGKMPRARSSNAAVTIGLKVYLIGGWDATPKFDNDADGTFHSAVDVFDLSTGKITVARWALPLPLRRAFSAVEFQDKIVLVGGLGVGASHFELLNNITQIDPDTGYASELAPLPFATFAPAAGVIGNELFVFGGMFKTGPMDYEYVSHIYAFNFGKGLWRHTGRYLTETKGFSQVMPFQDGLAILGGHRYFEDRDEPVATFEMFTKPKDL